MRKAFKGIIQPRPLGLRAVSVVFVGLLVFTLLCTIPTSPTHEMASGQPMEHRASSFGCIVDYLSGNGAPDQPENSSTWSDLAPFVSAAQQPLLSGASINPRKLKEFAALRVDSQVRRRVVLLI